jgi:hypothetical protein
MSTCGEIQFYSIRHVRNVPDVLRRVVQYFAPGTFGFVTRSQIEDHGWDDFLNDGSGVPNVYLTDTVNALPVLADVATLYMAQRSLHLSLCDSPFSRTIVEQVKTQIPESIRHDFVPADISIYSGGHDIIEEIEQEPGSRFVARTDFSVTFFSYSVPYRPQSRFVAEFLNLPVMLEIRKELEAVAGPMEVSASWYY